MAIKTQESQNKSQNKYKSQNKCKKSFPKKAFFKKAFFFTFLAILLTSILLIVFIKTPAAAQTQKHIETTKIKVNLINDFTQNVKEVYLPRIVFFAAKKVLINYTNVTYDDLSLSPFLYDGTTPHQFDLQFNNDMQQSLLPLILEIQNISENYPNALLEG